MTLSHTPRAPGWLDRWPVIALILLASISPLLVVHLPPLVDLYGHLGRYAVQTDLPGRPELQPYFSYEWKLIGNLGGDIIVQALYPLLGLEGSVRATVILTQLLGAIGLLALSRAIHGRITAFALAAIPMLYGYPFNYGFINYALSMALAMLAYVAWLHWHRAERRFAAGVWLAVAGAAIWVAHTYGWAFLGLLCGSTMLAQVFADRDRPVAAVRRILAACWPLLLPIIPMVIWRAGSSGAAISGWDYSYKLNWLMSPLRTYWRDFDLASLAVIAALLGWAVVSKATRFDRGIGIAALLCFAFFFVLPFRVFGSAFADMRLLPYALALALVAIAPGQALSKARWWALIAASAVAAAFFGVRLASAGQAYAAQDTQVQAALRAVDKMPMGARVVFLSVKRCRALWALGPLDHLAGAAMARRNAFVNDQWQQPGVNPLKVSFPAAEPFVRDPSHLVYRDDCGAPLPMTLSGALSRLPPGVFTHVWIVGAYDTAPPPPGFVLVPDTGTSVLFEAVPATPDQATAAGAAAR